MTDGWYPPVAYKLSLQLVVVTLFWSTTIALSFLGLAEEDYYGHAYVLGRVQPNSVVA